MTTPHSNLPVQLSSFVGREREIAELLQLLDDVRLLTLVQYVVRQQRATHGTTLAGLSAGNPTRTGTIPDWRPVRPSA